MGASIAIAPQEDFGPLKDHTLPCGAPPASEEGFVFFEKMGRYILHIFYEANASGSRISLQRCGVTPTTRLNTVVKCACDWKPTLSAT